MTEAWYSVVLYVVQVLFGLGAFVVGALAMRRELGRWLQKHGCARCRAEWERLESDTAKEDGDDGGA